MMNIEIYLSKMYDKTINDIESLPHLMWLDCTLDKIAIISLAL